MASKKATGKKATKRPKKKHGGKSNGGSYSGTRPCTLDEICKYLSKDLADWLKKFNADYTAVRKALCNVERQAFGDGTGTAAGRFCKNGGPGSEPNNPDPPPIWT